MLTRLTRTACATLCAVAVVALARAADPIDRPPPADVKEAVATLRDVFEKDYAASESNAQAKKQLARKLFDGAAKRKTPAMRFASYDEARRLAAAGGDAKLALNALSALQTNFRGLPAELTAETLRLLGDADLTAADAIELLGLVQESAAGALEREDYAGAVTLGKLAVTAAKKSEDPDAAAEARQFLARAEALKAAVETIKSKPDDPEANNALGQYWAFTRGRWDVGLKYLAKGTNAELAKAAALDLQNPKTAKERTAAADLWYKLATGAKGAEQRRLVDRACAWYAEAIAVATGDDDLKPTERLKQIEKEFPGLFDQTLTGHTGAAAGVAVLPDGRTVVSVGNDHMVRLWDASTGALRQTLTGHAAWVGCVAVAPDGSKFATAGGDGPIRVWDAKTGKEVAKLEGHTVAVRGLALSADGKTLYSASSDKSCRAWDFATGKELRQYGDRATGVESVAVSPDGKFVLVGNEVGVVTVFDAQSGDVVSKYDRHERTMVYTVVVTADGKTALSGARDKAVHVWDIATGKPLRRFEGHTEQVYQITLSPDGKRVLTASYDKTARLWDFATGKELKRFEGHTDGVQGACFTPDGRFVFSASWDKTVRKWRVPLFPSPPKKLD